jgi:hypothetical protein
MEKVFQSAHLINGDLLTRLFLAGRLRGLGLFLVQRFRLQQPKIRVIALRQPVACGTLAAGFVHCRRLFAQQRLGKTARQIELADPALAGQQQGMRESRTARVQRSPGGFVKANYVHKQFDMTFYST